MNRSRNLSAPIKKQCAYTVHTERETGTLRALSATMNHVSGTALPQVKVQRIQHQLCVNAGVFNAHPTMRKEKESGTKEM